MTAPEWEEEENPEILPNGMQRILRAKMDHRDEIKKNLGKH